ncbi:MAG: sugar phosphate isomerase/epimerase family protein [Lentisphaeria bacterium]|nr:sugar phosphate isomerase/epimerase family protein [Lentisphaeria bacterium]
MLKSISYWSMPGGLEGRCEIKDAFKLAKNAGFQALEFAIGLEGLLTPETDKATCLEYKKIAEDSGLAAETLASGISWAVSPTDADPAVRARSIDIHAKALQRAAWLGCEAMLFVPGAVVIPWEPGYRPVRYDLALERARHAVIELGEVAADLGVVLAVENVWNGLFYSPLEFAGFIDEIGNPAVGVYFDVGNILNHQQWPPHWIELLDLRISRVHLKDFQLSNGTMNGFCDLGKGDMPWKETMQALRNIGYNKTLTAEMMPPAEGLLERTSAAMDAILAL